ncbi:MAG: hypothetical protein GXP56_08835, partial [Deltaproteobacteria bacterium]|nr:hypothetical protein [Deltaproteobacteria bacterium]
MGNKRGKNKNGLPEFDSNHDFLEAFEKKNKDLSESHGKIFIKSSKLRKTNKHGVKVLDH